MYVVDRGASQSGNTSDAMELLEQLKLQRLLLAEEEKRLEEMYVRMQQCLKNVADDSEDSQYPLILRLLVYQTCPCGTNLCLDVWKHKIPAWSSDPHLSGK